jgi:hypothetical protein
MMKKEGSKNIILTILFLLLLILISGKNLFQEKKIQDEILLQPLPPNIDLFQEVLNQNEPYHSNFHWSHPRTPGPHDGDYLQRVQADPSYYAGLVNTANTYDPFDCGTSQFCAHVRKTRETIIVYLITQDPQYYQKIIDSATGGPNGYDPPFDWGQRIYHVAMIYDWMYNYLTPSDKSLIESRLQQYMDTWEFLYETEMSVFNSFFTGRWSPVGYLMSAVSLYQEIPNSDQYFQYAGNLYHHDMVDSWRAVYKGGGWHEGLDYQARVFKSTYQSLDLVSKAFGVDQFQQESYFEDLLYFPIYHAQPNTRFVNRADTSHHTLYSFSGKFDAYLGFTVKYNNPYAFWFYQNSPWGAGINAPSGNPLTPIIEPWSEPWPAQNPPTTNPYQDPNFPLHHYFEGIGQILARSDWTEDATFVEFGIDKGYWSHSGLDSGRFSIYDRGSLAIDSGLYGMGANSDHERFYKEQAYAHNLMLFYDPDDTSTSWSKTVQISTTGATANLPYPNDGGLKRYRSGFSTPRIDNIHEKNQFGDMYNFGSMEKVDMQIEYVYALADLLLAYKPNFPSSQFNPPGVNVNYPTGATDRTDRLDWYERSWLFIRPNTFVNLDRWDLKKPNVDPIWLLHFINQPTVQGNEVTVLRTENVRCESTYICNWPSGLQYTNNGPTGENNKYYQYDGKLKLTNIYPGPGNLQIETIGGPGRRYEDLEGYNHDGCGSYGLNSPFPPCPVVQNANPLAGIKEPGSWRIQITNPTNPEQDVFLNIMQTGTSSANFAPVEQLTITNGNYVGARFTTEANEDWATLFSRANQGAISSLTYNLNSGNIKNLVLDLTPNANYLVIARDSTTQAITHQQTYTSNSRGILRFDLSLIVNSDVTVSDNEPPIIISLLPNQIAITSNTIPLNIITDEDSTCRYSEANQQYAQMPNTLISTNGIDHSINIATYQSQSILSYANNPGQQFAFYISCADNPPSGQGGPENFIDPAIQHIITYDLTPPEFINLGASSGSLELSFDTTEPITYIATITDIVTNDQISLASSQFETSHSIDFITALPSTTFQIDLTITDSAANSNSIIAQYTTDGVIIDEILNIPNTRFVGIAEIANNGQSVYGVSEFRYGYQPPSITSWPGTSRVLFEFDYSPISNPNLIPVNIVNLQSVLSFIIDDINYFNSPGPVSHTTEIYNLINPNPNHPNFPNICMSDGGTGNGPQGSSNWHYACKGDSNSGISHKNWNTLGGDFNTQISSTYIIQSPTINNLVNIGVTDLVQEQLLNENNGFIMKTSESSSQQAQHLEILLPTLRITGNTENTQTLECPLSSQFPNSVCKGAFYNQAIGVQSCATIYPQSAVLKPQSIGNTPNRPGLYEQTETIIDGLDNDCDGLVDESTCQLTQPTCSSVPGSCQGSIPTCNIITEQWECQCPPGQTCNLQNQCEVTTTPLPTPPSSFSASLN